MISSATFALRRQRLLAAVPGPIVLIGHTHLPRNTPGHFLPFRQDSTFLYLTGCDRPGAVAVLSAEEGFELYLPQPPEDDELWHGPGESLEDLGSRLGAGRIRPRSQAEARVQALRRLGAPLHTLPVADPAARAELERWTGQRLVYGATDAASGGGSEALVDQLVAQRLVKDSEELAEMRAAAEVTRAAHLQALALTRPGATEREIAVRVQAVFLAAGCVEAYPSIVTVRGEVLHCPRYENTLHSGQLLLLDAGAERPSGYASDVTRTFPVSGRFDPFQRDVYALVLRAQKAAIERCRPGVVYRDVHAEAALVLAEGLVELGLLRGKPAELLETGASTVFFPHGAGHPLGLDVHDLRSYGTRAGWAPKRKEGDPPSNGYSKVNWTLAPGMVFTVEPGLYFVPSLLRSQDRRLRHGEAVRFERAERHIGFGGVRIEDDVLVTDGAPEVLSAGIPRTIGQIEERCST
jgi:Xaa-Pro aminopeptidase/Xaa-Pro dipeptidase